MYGLPDHLDYNLDIVFVGYNPGEKSAITNYHYAGRGNQFWKLLFDSGLTPRLYAPEEDSQIIKLGYGLTNIVARPSKSSSDLSPEEMKEGAIILQEKIQKYNPKIVSFLGKDVYRKYMGFKASKPVSYGIASNGKKSGNTYLFLAPNPSGRSTIPYVEKLEAFKDLYRVLEQIKNK